MIARVIVCGGRDYADGRRVREVLDEHVDPGSVVVHGAAEGADDLADHYAYARNIEREVHPAEWSKHGRAAGPIRNQEMVDAGADLCIAFPGGRGTADMVRRAKAAGIPVVEVEA